MIFNRDQLQKPFKPSLLVTVIGSESDQNNIKSFFQEEIDHIYSNRVLINGISSVDDFKIEKSYQKNPNGQGLINTTWINKMFTVKPSVCIIVYQMKSDLSFREEEKKLIKDIQKIKTGSPDTILYLIILTGTIPAPSDIEERSDSIYRVKDLKAVYPFTSLEAIKKSSDVRKIHMNVISSAKDYYRSLKQKYKKRVNDISIKDEIKIKAYVKIGILALIKNRTPKTKHFEEAYKLLSNYNDMSKYLYGNNKLLNFCEIRAAADWLFHQIHKINKTIIKKDKSKDSFIIKANIHHMKFASNPYIDKQEGNYYHFFDLFWSYTFNEFIGFESPPTIDSVAISKNFAGFYYLKGLYSLMRIISQLPLLDNVLLNTVVIDNRKYAVDQLKKVNAKFYEKPIIFIDNKDVLNPKYIPFNLEMYFRYFLLENNVNVIALKKKINEQLFPNIMMTFDAQASYALKQKPQEDKTSNKTKASTTITPTPTSASDTAVPTKPESHFNNINFYLNVINLPSSIVNYSIDDITKIHQLMIKSKTIWKYPIVYYAYLEKTIQIWMTMPALTVQDKERLFYCLLRLGNHRELNDKEEEVFVQLLSDEEMKNSPTIKSPISIKVNNKDDCLNKIFSIDHNIIGGNKLRNVLELVDFEFTVTTCLKTKPIKYNSITCFFGYEKRNKEFTQFDKEVTYDQALKFNYQILLKTNEQALMLKKIVFMIEGFPLPFEYVVHSLKENVVLVKPKKKSILEFNVPKMVRLGVNQFYQIKCAMTKDESENVEIGSVVIDFEKMISISDLLTKVPPSQSTPAVSSSSVMLPSNPSTSTANISSTSMKSTFEKAAQSTSNTSSMKSTFEKAPVNTSSSMKSAFEKASGTSMKSTFSQLVHNNPLSSMVQSTKMSEILNQSRATKPSQSSTPQSLSSQSMSQFPPQQQSTPTPTAIPQQQHQPPLIPEIKPEAIPEYYVIESDGTLTKTEDKVIFKIDNFETSNKSISLLIKFNSVGKSTIGYQAKYRIIKRQFTDDQVESRESGRITFEIIEPFEVKYNIESNFYMTCNNQMQFNTNSKIKVNLCLKSLLDKDATITDITLDTPNKSNRIMTAMTKVLSLPKEVNEQVLTIMKSSTYIIPFEVYYSSEANGVCGYADINWNTKDLCTIASNEVINVKRFELPEITAVDFKFDISYIVPNEVSINSDVDLVIRLHNKEKEFKRILLQVDTSNEFAFVGKMKNRMLIYPNEVRDVIVKMIPMTTGKSKLPSCMITLFPIQKYEGKIYSIDYLPDYITIKP